MHFMHGSFLLAKTQQQSNCWRLLLTTERRQLWLSAERVTCASMLYSCLMEIDRVADGAPSVVFAPAAKPSFRPMATTKNVAAPRRLSVLART